MKTALSLGKERFLTLLIIPSQEREERRAIAIAIIAGGKPVGGIAFLAVPGKSPRHIRDKKSFH
jgi:hypothetical protein